MSDDIKIKPSKEEIQKNLNDEKIKIINGHCYGCNNLKSKCTCSNNKS